MINIQGIDIKTCNAPQKYRNSIHNKKLLKIIRQTTQHTNRQRMSRDSLKDMPKCSKAYFIKVQQRQKTKNTNSNHSKIPFHTHQIGKNYDTTGGWR